MKKILLTLLCLFSVGIVAKAETKTITIEPSDLNRSETAYVTTAFTFSKDNVTFTINNVNPKTGQMQANKAVASAFYLYNNTPIKNIFNIEITFSQAGDKTPNNGYLALDDEEISSTISSSDIVGSWDSANLIATWDCTTKLSNYFRINFNTLINGTNRFSKIVITYDDNYSSEEQTQCEKPSAKLNGLTNLTANSEVYVGDVITLSCQEGESMVYTLTCNDENVTTGESTDPVDLEIKKGGEYQLKVVASKEGLEDNELDITFLVNRNDAGIAYNVASTKAYLDGLSYFTAPYITNPNNLSLTYSSSNPDVAEISANGVLNIKAEGETIISATSKETDVYNAGEAYYTLCVDAEMPDNFSDKLTWESFASQNSTYYQEFTYTSENGVTYFANIAPNEFIQLRSTNSNSGIVVTNNPNGYKLNKISVEWNSTTSADRELNIYGDNEAYSAATELYGSVKGTKIGSFIFNDDADTEMAIEDEYTYVGMRSNSGAMYITSLTLEWVKAEAEPENTPVISFGENSHRVYNFFTATVGDFEQPTLSNPQGVEVTYTSDAPFVATVDENGNVIVSGEVGSTTIRARFAGNDTYNAVEDYYLINVSATHESVKALSSAKDGQTCYIEFPMTVAYANGYSVYAYDENGDFMQIYGSNASGLKSNQVIPSGWTAVYTLFNGTPELVPDEVLTATAGTEEFTPEVLSAEDVKADLVNGVYVIKNVIFDEATPSESANFTGISDNVELNFRNNFKLESVEAGHYDVEVVVIIYNSTVQLYVIGYTSLKPEAPEFTDDHSTDIKDGKLTSTSDKYALKFKKVEGVDIYYKHVMKENTENNGSEENGENDDNTFDVNGEVNVALATRADVESAEDTEVDEHEGYTKVEDEDYEKGITLTSNHSALQYYAYSNGVKGDLQTLEVDLGANAGEGSSIVEIEAAGCEARYYDLQGREVVNPAKGLYIRVVGGKAEKVLINK